MILVNNNRKKTLLQNTTTLSFIKRYMESESKILTAYEKGNSFYLYGCLEEEIYAYYAEESFVYVMDHLENLTFSQMLDKCYDQLSYQISTQSFEAIIQGMLSNPRTFESTKRVILLYDDLGMFDHDTFKRIDSYTAREYYHRLFTEQNQKNEIPENLPKTLDSCTTSSDHSTGQNNYISINNPEDFKSNAASESALFNNGNNNQIIFLTILAFSIILLSSFLINKYYPQKEKTIEELDQLKENYSVFETLNMGYNNLLLLLSCIIPPIIYLLYSYRYYYQYKINKLFKK